MLLRFLVGRVLAAEPTELGQFELARSVLLVLGGVVVLLLALGARHGDLVAHFILFRPEAEGGALRAALPG
jgi:hypothetical protein